MLNLLAMPCVHYKKMPTDEPKHFSKGGKIADDKLN
jgi:hypothetical protein